MIGTIDALLLARDDAENHFDIAKPFLDAGLPIYIDKPIALSLESLRKIYRNERYPGQVFTCSALRYSQQLQISYHDRQELGDIREIVATTPKCWSKYSVHIIEPVLKMLPTGDRLLSYEKEKDNNHAESSTLIVRWKSGIQTKFIALGDTQAEISIKVIGAKSTKLLTFSDTFSAFKAALSDFISGIRSNTIKSPKRFNEQVVDLIEKGMP